MLKFLIFISLILSTNQKNFSRYCPSNFFLVVSHLSSFLTFGDLMSFIIHINTTYLKNIFDIFFHRFFCATQEIFSFTTDCRLTLHKAYYLFNCSSTNVQLLLFFICSSNTRRKIDIKIRKEYNYIKSNHSLICCYFGDD